MVSVSAGLTPEPARSGESGLLASAAAGLHPAYFAMVMATGIVSIAAQLRGWTNVAVALLYVNVCVYAVLWVLAAVRIIRFWERFVADVLDHGRCVGFFTTVAATCVLGNQFLLVESVPGVAKALWGLGIVLWAVITYGLLTVLTVKHVKPSLAEGINGAWLVAVVAAQAVAALGGLIAPQLDGGRDAAVFVALMLWLGGGMLYLWIIVLIFYRYTFFPLDPRQLAPPYWINMGAMAISTLTGTILAENAGGVALLERLETFVLGATLVFWSTATWWIPFLVALGFWRHVVRRVSITYDVVYWSAVFPLGMYAACTHRLARVVELPFLDPIARIMAAVALVAWGITFLGLLLRQGRWLLARRQA